MDVTLRTAFQSALTTLGWPAVDFVIEHPKDLTHGDYTCNVALVLARSLGQSPRVVAEKIVTTLAGTLPQVSTWTVAGPGFINLTLTREFFTTALQPAVAAPAAWGWGQSQQGQVVLFEYTSPNLFKPLHIGNLVGNIVGESFTRLFEMAGAEVVRLNYPSDIGLTVAKGVWGLQATGADPSDIAALGEAYRVGNEAYENDSVAKEAIEAVNRALYAGTDHVLNELRARGIATSRYSLAAICARLGTKFDDEITESTASQPGISLVQQHIGTVFVDSQGAVVYPGEMVGLHTRVFLNSQGLPTYEAKDLGNFALKQERYPHWTRSVIVTGNEQTEYFKVLYTVIRAIFPDTAGKQLEHIPTGFLTLTTGKMSSRKGNVLTGESLLSEMQAAAAERASQSRADDLAVLTNQIAVASIKYQILRQGIGSNIVFDKEKALSFEGDSGPYLQYTYARAESVLAKAAASGVKPNVAVAPALPYDLERLLYRFPTVTEAALTDRSPQLLVTYLTSIAGTFNAFYATEMIADASDEMAPYKAFLTTAVATTLRNGLWALGIEAPPRM